MSLSSKMAMQSRLGTLKLELESTEHVLSVTMQKQPSKRLSKEEIDKEVGELEEYKQHLLDEIFELQVLVGGHGV